MTNAIFMIDFNGVKFSLPTNAVFKRLAANATTALLSLHDTVDGSNYQVPIGKKFTIIYIENYDSSDASARIISSTAVDATTGAIELFLPGVTSLISNLIFLSTEVAADAFITMDGTGVWTSGCILYGVEEDV